MLTYVSFLSVLAPPGEAILNIIYYQVFYLPVCYSIVYIIQWCPSISAWLTGYCMSCLFWVMLVWDKSQYITWVWQPKDSIGSCVTRLTCGFCHQPSELDLQIRPLYCLCIDIYKQNPQPDWTFFTQVTTNTGCLLGLFVKIEYIKNQM